MTQLRALLAAGWLLLAPHLLPAADPPFRAGAATSNITPPLGTSINGGMQDRRAAYVHDELHARCLVLDDGATRLAIAVCDLCMIPRHVVDEARARIQAAVGIPPERVLISATHTHEAPTCTGVFQSEPDRAYVERLATRIADGVQRAAYNLAPARIGWGSAALPEHVFNRRWRLKPGAIPPNPFGVTDTVQMNPPVASPDLLEPAGPTDPELSILSLQTREGRPLAVLGNYSLHYVGGEGPGHISADYFGMFADRVQELLGADRLDPPFVGLLSNGTSGDVNNINFRGEARPTEPYGQMRRVAHGVAEAAARVVRRIEHRDWVQLGAAQAALELGVRKPATGELAQAREIVARAPGPVLKSLEEIYARESILIADYPDRVELHLQALRIGDVCIFAAPCEIFVEIGLELKQRSPVKPCFTISLANGYNGYLPTPEHHRLGGYETWRARSSYLEVEAAPRIVAKLLELAVSLGR